MLQVPHHQAVKAGLSPIRVLIVEDHLVARLGISTVVSTEPDMVVVAEATNGEQAVELHHRHKPDITLMDIRLSGALDGVGASRAILAERPTARIIALTTYAGDGDIRRALEAGVRGYLTKEALKDELLTAIRAVHAGRRYLASPVAVQLAEHMSDDALTTREQDVLTMVARGFSNKRVADALDISEHTVKAHLKNILGKLHADDRTQAATEALRRGLIQP